MKYVFRVLLVLLAITMESAFAAPNGLVVLFTDYGADSVYVGAIKGAIYSKYPAARLDSITNSVPPFDVLAGAYMLAEACGEFPAGTTFCCVVDPGVGTPRKRIALETKNGLYFVAPDNGLLTLVAERFGIAALREAANKTLWREGEISQTFQGRDVFGPVAAALAKGVPLAEVGPELKEMVKIEVPVAHVEKDLVRGDIVRVDGYGNLVTNIRWADLEKIGFEAGESADITIGKAHFVAPIGSAYADVAAGDRLVLVQSIGYIECAINKGNLANDIGEGLHAVITIKKP